MGQRKKILIYLLIITAVCLLNISNSQARSLTKTKRFEEQIKTGKDKTLFIDDTQADISISTWNKNKIKVIATLEIKCSDEKLCEEFLNQVEMTLEPYRNGFLLSLSTPDVFIENNVITIARSIKKIISGDTGIYWI